MITINNHNRPPRWMFLIILLLIGLLIVALYRGCRQHSASSERDIDYKGRIEKLKKDSAELVQKISENDFQNELLNGQIELAHNRNESYLDSFRVLNNQINALKNRYKPVVPNVDTNVTSVPNDYIEDCSECFGTLDKVQKIGLNYKSELESSKRLNISKINLLNDRIKILEGQNIRLKMDYTSLIDSAKNKNELRRTLFLSLGVISINQYFPNGIGGGFLYEDKKRRIYGGRYYISRFGSVYQADVALPLSLKFK